MVPLVTELRTDFRFDKGECERLGCKAKRFYNRKNPLTNRYFLICGDCMAARTFWNQKVFEGKSQVDVIRRRK